MKKFLTTLTFFVISCTSQDANLGGGTNKPSTHLSAELSSVMSHGAPAVSHSAPSASVSATAPVSSSDCFVCTGQQPTLLSDCGCGGFYSEAKGMCLSECNCTCEVVDAGFSVGGGGTSTSH